MNKLKHLFLLLSILTITSFIHANERYSVDISMDSLFLYAMDLSYFNPVGLDQAVDDMAFLYKISPSSQNDLLYSGMLFIQRSNSLTLDERTHELFEKILPKINLFPLNKRLRVEKAISFYLQNTSRDYQFLEFHQKIFKEELLKSNDYVFKIYAFFTISWNLPEKTKVFGNMKSKYSDIALKLYDEYSQHSRNDTIEALIKMHEVAECLKANCEPMDQISKYLKAMRASKKIGYNLMYSYQAYKIARLYLTDKAYKYSEKFFQIAIDNSSEFPVWQGHYISDFAFLFQDQGLYRRAIKEYEIAYDKFIELVCYTDNNIIAKSAEKFIYILDQLTSCYLKINNTKEGFKCFKLAKEMKKAHYLEDYSNVDFFYKNLNKSLENLNFEIDKDLVKNFMDEHNIHEEYPDFSPSLRSDTTLMFEFQDMALKESKEIHKNTKIKTKLFANFKYLVLIIFIIFFVLTIFIFLKYLQTKKRLKDLNTNYESLNSALEISKKDLKMLNRKLPKKGEPSFIQISDKNKTFLNYNDILYVEANGASVIFHMVNSQIFEASSIFKYYRKKLPNYLFVRIHRSYMVNKKEIKKVYGRKVQLNTGVELPIGKTYLNDFYRSVFEVR